MATAAEKQSSKTKISLLYLYFVVDPLVVDRANSCLLNAWNVMF